MKKKYTLRYKRTTIYLDKNPRTGICTCCGKPAKTQMHHIEYKYTTDEVKKKPKLALEETIELCFYDHRLCNMLRQLDENKERVKILRRLMKCLKN